MQPQVLRLFTCGILLGPAVALQSLPLPIDTVSNIGLGVWIENIAVRSSGEILAVGLTPNLFQINPLGNTTPVIVETFPAPITAIAGLTETLPDVFYVTAGNITNTTVVATAGTLSVWEVNMAGYTSKAGLVTPIKKIADFPEAGLLDGMTTLNSLDGLLLISDPVLGIVWSLNINTGAKSQIISIADMKAITGMVPALGVNGIRYDDGYLYFTTTTQQIFVRLPINPDGSAAGNPVIINSSFGRPDDFALDEVNNCYVATNADSLTLLKADGSSILLAGGASSTALPGITGAKFGRTEADKEILYMGTTGGSELYATTRNFTIPGGISKINIGAAGYYNID